jgi:hypothetical protein
MVAIARPGLDPLTLEWLARKGLPPEIASLAVDFAWELATRLALWSWRWFQRERRRS